MNEYTTKELTKLQHVKSDSTLFGKSKNNIKTAHLEMTVAERILQCVRSNRLFSPISSFLILCRKFVYSHLVEIFDISTGFWSRFYLQNSKYLILRSTSEVNLCDTTHHIDAVMMSPQNYKNRPRNAGVITENKSRCSSWTPCRTVFTRRHS